MRRPGTLPVHSAINQRTNNSNTISNNNNNHNHNHNPSAVSTNNIFSPTSGQIDNNAITSNGSTRHMSHSLRRNPPALPARADSCRIVNDDHHSSQKHSPPCPQSSYPTLPINGHVSSYYYRERDSTGTSSSIGTTTRERTSIRDRELPPVPHRNEPMELEIHDQLAGNAGYRE
ncbi:GATA zinc finger domain-containing protein 14-like [Microplitis mediator]|uniref:GATA zinc finger domain-containing protein 14-like n=1 Tax=Microplitis mediator TaxID=375433 RepID=UPI002555E276|nr:GATA zinc finger domain-containing protein 14-like [Microplitis mediator]